VFDLYGTISGLTRCLPEGDGTRSAEEVSALVDAETATIMAELGLVSMTVTGTPSGKQQIRRVQFEFAQASGYSIDEVVIKLNYAQQVEFDYELCDGKIIFTNITGMTVSAQIAGLNFGSGVRMTAATYERGPGNSTIVCAKIRIGLICLSPKLVVTAEGKAAAAK